MSGRALTLLAAGAVVAAGGAVAALALLRREPPPPDDTAAVTRAWEALRDAVLEGDDRAFFEMHSREAREKALQNFPLVRSWYVSASEEEKSAFRERFGVTEKEFLEGDPGGLVVRLMPEKSGRRERAGMFQVAKVASIRFPPPEGDPGGRPREAILLLDIREAVRLEPGQRIPDTYLPTIVFVRDPEGWKRRSFFFGH